MKHPTTLTTLTAVPRWRPVAALALCLPLAWPALSGARPPAHTAAALAASTPEAETRSDHEPEALPEALSVRSDTTLSLAQREALSLAARRYYAFWHTGEARYARAALAPDFIDRSLPPGRPQGPEGPLQASRQFRAAVPDLQLQVEEMLLVGDRVVGRLRFRGHFTGQFMGHQGQGQAVDFMATDIYRIAQGRIAENWHLEDNLTLLKQLGVVAP